MEVHINKIDCTNAVCVKAYIGKRVEVDDCGCGTIIAESKYNVTIGLDAPGCRMLVIPKSELVAV